VSTPITIRPAKPEDASAIAALVAEAYTPYIPRIGRKPGPMLEDYAQVVADSVVYVCLEEEDIVGVLVMLREGDEMLLLNVAVLPRCKGQGIGKRLMTFCEDHARGSGCAAIRLYTHELMSENQDIYKKLGYVETHRATEHGFARVFMRKAL
jgi:ribosomal protein S18 acetylase RimI-like enzyme